jgi:hypothetical protein
MPRKPKMPHKRPFDKLAVIGDSIDEDIFESSSGIKTNHLAEWKTLKTLIASTSDICRARYHYYCHEAEADFANVAQEYFVVAANCKKLEVVDPEGETDGFAIDENPARLIKKKAESKYYHSTGNLFAFVPEKTDTWREEYLSQLGALGALHQHTQAKLDVVFFPEFGFPVQPKNSTAKSFLEQIVARCASAVHRPFFFTGSAHQEGPVLNRGFVSPPCVDEVTASHDAKNTVEIFNRKADAVLKTLPGELSALSLKHLSSGKLQVRINTDPKEHEIIETSSAEFDKAVRSSPDEEIKRIGSNTKNFVNNAYKFNESIFNAERQRKKEQTNGFIPITKKAPALKLKEALEPQGMLDLDVFVTKLGVFAVLICYDAFDPGMFLTLLRLYQGSWNKLKDFEHPAPDVILVPAYNRSKKLLLMCRNLSFATNSVVVYASNHEDHAGKPLVYVCGREWKDWEKALTGKSDGKIENFFSHTSSGDFEVLKLDRLTLNNVMSLAANPQSASIKTVKDRAVTNNLF